MFSEATAELERFDPRSLSRPELADALAAHDRLIARVEANRLAILAAVDALGDRGADAAAMGRSVSRRSERQAKSDAKSAGALVEMPRIAEALQAGEITTEHVAACADAAERLSPGEADELADMAASMPADRFAKKARQQVNERESALAVEKRYRRQRRRREASTWTSGDGMVHLYAQFDPLVGAAVAAELAQSTDELWRADGGRDGTPDDVRSRGQRRLDALAELIAPGATAKALAEAGLEDEQVTELAPQSKRPHPRFMVHLFFNVATGTIEAADGEALPAHVLAEVGPQAEVVGHVFDGDGQALWLGRSRRLASRSQWISLIARDRGCNDCGADLTRIEAHHTHEWDHGGPTDIDNLEAKCHSCHGNEHRGQRRPGKAA